MKFLIETEHVGIEDIARLHTIFEKQDEVPLTPAFAKKSKLRILTLKEPVLQLDQAPSKNDGGLCSILYKGPTEDLIKLLGLGT